MKRFVISIGLIFGFVAILSVGLRGAGSNAAEEAAIKKIISAGNPSSLADAVFWSGAYKRPAVGTETPEPKTGDRAISERVPGSQKGSTQVIRIVVADSRDLAYEYSKGSLDFDVKSGQHFHTDTGILRVWQKQGGDWKIAATFARPYDE